MATSQQKLEEAELDTPLPPNTLCTALYDFAGNGPDDLAFKKGEKIVIVEPSRVMYWYMARNSIGKTGLVPITFLVKVVESDAPPLPLKPPHLLRKGSQDTPPTTPRRSVSPFSPRLAPNIPDYLQIRDESSIDTPPSLPPPRPPRSLTLPRPSREGKPPPPPLPLDETPGATSIVSPSIDHRPPMPLPHHLTAPKQSSCRIQVGKYPTIQAFREESGWFKPTPDYVLCKKTSMSVQGFKGMLSGVYFFQHKYMGEKQYAGQSLNLYMDLVSLFSRLYEKKEDHLNNLERELRYNSPDADNWNVSVWACHPENLCLELSKLIVRQRTLPPNGLNEALEFTSRKHFRMFCEWYTEFRLKGR